jgi:anti-sigma factor RsiW
LTVSRHVKERLDEWIDGRLSSADERDVERHLEECGSCREEAAAVRAARAAVACRGAGVELPAGLADRIRGRLDAEDAIARAQATGAAPGDRRRSPARTSRRAVVRALPLAAGLLLAAAAVLWTVLTTSAAGPVDDAFAQFGELAGAGETWRAAQVDGPRELERRWRAADLGFPTRVLDLSMSGYTLAGGRATRLGDRPAALAIYRGPGGVMTCWMFDGRDRLEEDFPETVDVHEANGFRFHVFERQGVTLVVWREGDVLCVLSARMSRDAVVELAHAKAMAPPLA